MTDGSQLKGEVGLWLAQRTRACVIRVDAQVVIAEALAIRWGEKNPT